VGLDREPAPDAAGELGARDIEDGGDEEGRTMSSDLSRLTVEEVDSRDGCAICVASSTCADKTDAFMSGLLSGLTVLHEGRGVPMCKPCALVWRRLCVVSSAVGR
jgi:hypothetical protein